MFASDPWIFGINGDLSAQDDVSPSRSGSLRVCWLNISR